MRAWVNSKSIHGHFLKLRAPNGLDAVRVGLDHWHGLEWQLGAFWRAAGTCHAHAAFGDVGWGCGRHVDSFFLNFLAAFAHQAACAWFTGEPPRKTTAQVLA